MNKISSYLHFNCFVQILRDSSYEKVEAVGETNEVSINEYLNAIDTCTCIQYRSEPT